MPSLTAIKDVRYAVDGARLRVLCRRVHQCCPLRFAASVRIVNRGRGHLYGAHDA
jgi:hypothetical protein